MEKGINSDFQIENDGVQTFWIYSSTNKIKAQTIAFRYKYYAKYLYRMHDYDRALECIFKALKIVAYDSFLYGSCCSFAGQCYLAMKCYRKAWYYFERAQAVDEYLKFGEKNANLATCLLHCGQYTRAKQQFQKVLKLYEDEILTREKETADIYYYIGLCYSKLEKFNLSNLYLKKALQIYKSLENAPLCVREYVEVLLCLTTNHCRKVNCEGEISEFCAIIQSHSPILETCEIDSALTVYEIGALLLNMNFVELSSAFLETSQFLFESTNNATPKRLICQLYSSIGLCLMKQHDFNQSLKYFQKSLDMFHLISTDIERDVDIARALERFASCLLELKQIENAEQYFQKSLRILEVVASTKEIIQKVFSLHNNIGVRLMELHQYEKALEHLEMLASAHSNLLKDTSVGSNADCVLNNMGTCMMNLGRHKEAFKIFSKVLKIQAKMEIGSKLSKDVVLTLNNIGLCLMEEGKFNDSFMYFQRAYDVCLQAFDIDRMFAPVSDMVMADTLNNLGLNYMAVKAYRHAIECFQDALSYYKNKQNQEGIKDVVPEETESIFIVWNNLGLCHLSTNLHLDALKYFKKSLELLEDCAFAENADETIAAVCNNIGLCLLRCEYYNDSLNFFLRSISLYQKSTPRSNQDVAAVIHNIALVHINLGELEESFQMLHNALELYHTSCADLDMSSNYAKVFHSLGMCKKEMGDFSEALTYFERSLAIQRRVADDETTDTDVLRTLHNCGLCLSAIRWNEMSSIEKIYFDLTLKSMKSTL